MTFDQLHTHIRALAQKIAESGRSYSCLVAVGRGGMGIVPLLAHLLDIRDCHYINYARHAGWRGDSFQNRLPAGALVIDDAAESGGSFATLAIQYGAFDSAVVVAKPNCRFPITYKVLTSNDEADFVMPFEMRDL